VKLAQEKGASHLAFNVIAPDAAVKQVAFGPVSDHSQKTTEYALRIVMEHAHEVAENYKSRGLGI
tara:strand:+ start:48 stop:242 length:195 start_codon:yes stop_codon:yes gene_type:complete